jgi:hypothetical protein
LYSGGAWFQYMPGRWQPCLMFAFNFSNLSERYRVITSFFQILSSSSWFTSHLHSIIFKMNFVINKLCHKTKGEIVIAPAFYVRSGKPKLMAVVIRCADHVTPSIR